MAEEHQEHNETLSEMDEYYRRTRRRIIPRPTTPLGRLGCGAALVIWFSILLLPFAMFWLASGRTITIPHGNVPEASEHPLFEVRLIMEIENRGLQVKRSQIVPDDEQRVCVQSNVNYLLWESEEGELTALYCECYERESAEDDWVYMGIREGACNE